MQVIVACVDDESCDFRTHVHQMDYEKASNNFSMPRPIGDDWLQRINHVPSHPPVLVRTQGEIMFVVFTSLKSGQEPKAGDAALREVGAILQQTKRASDICGRIGGDEFCILALESTPDKSQEWANRLHEHLTKGLVVHKPTGASVGVAFFDGTHTELEEMLRLADETMYEVKRAGKGNVLVRSF